MFSNGMTAILDAVTGDSQTCETIYLADASCPVEGRCYRPTCEWLPGSVDLAGR